MNDPNELYQENPLGGTKEDWDEGDKRRDEMAASIVKGNESAKARANRPAHGKRGKAKKAQPRKPAALDF